MQPHRSDPDATRHRARTPLATALSLITTCLLVLLVLALGVSAWAVRSGQWAAHPVLSGSMQPTLPIGSVAVVERVPTSSLQPGDVITFHEPGDEGRLVTHRIAAIRRQDGRLVYQTKGDANPERDPWQLTLRGASSYRLAADVPYVGYASVWLRRPEIRTWLFRGAALVALWGVVQLFLPIRATRRPRLPARGTPTTLRGAHDPGVDP